MNFDNIENFDDRYRLTRHYSDKYDALARFDAEMAARPQDATPASVSLEYMKPEDRKKYREEQFRHMMAMQGVGQKEVEAETGGLAEPAVPNPLEMFTPQAGLVTAFGRKAGLSALKAVTKGVVSGGTGTVMQYPIGQATEVFQENHPILALPFNLLSTAISGATIENRLENLAVRTLNKYGIDSTATAVQKLSAAVKGKILRGQIDDPVTREAADMIWGEMVGYGSMRTGIKHPWEDIPGFGKVPLRMGETEEIDLAALRTAHEKAAAGEPYDWRKAMGWVREPETAGIPGYGRQIPRGTIDTEVEDLWGILGRKGETGDAAKAKNYWDEVMGTENYPAKEYHGLIAKGEGVTIIGTKEFDPLDIWKMMDEVKPITDRGSLRDRLRLVFTNLTDNQIDAVADIAEARAQSWASQTGRKATEWYGTHIADIKTGEVTDQTAKLAQGTIKGSVIFLEDGKAIIKAFANHDVSTAVHELAHIFRRDLAGEDLAFIEQWAGAKYGNIVKGWTREAEEKFARAFETYLQTGKAPESKLEKIFNYFKDWLTKIYGALKGEIPETNKEIHDVFDRLLTVKTGEPNDISFNFGRLASVEGPEEISKDLQDYILRDMVSQVQNAQSKTVTEVAGETFFAGSAYPDWFRRLSKEIKTSKENFLKIADKWFEGKPLTAKQQEIWNAVLKEAENLSFTPHYSRIADELASYTNQEPFTLEQGKKLLNYLEQRATTNKKIAQDVLGDQNLPIVKPPSDFADRAKDYLNREMKSVVDLPEQLQINWRRIDSAEEVQEAVDSLSLQFPDEMLKARGYQPQEQTELAAKELGLTVQKFVEMTGGQALGAKEIMAMRMLHVSSGQELTRLAAVAASPAATEADLFNFLKQFQVHYAVQNQYFKFRAEAGRALAIFRRQAAAQEDMIAEINQIINNAGGVGYAKEVAKMIGGLGGDPAKIASFNRGVSRGSGMLFEYYVNALVSNPVTHAANMIGNTMAALLQIPERYVATKISGAFGDQAFVEGEASRMMFAINQGMKDAYRLLANAFDQPGKSPLDIVDLTRAVNQMAKDLGPEDFGSKLELMQRKAITADNFRETWLGRAVNKVSPSALEEGGILARAVDGLGEAVRTSGKFLEGEDQFFKAIGYRMELNARAYRQAMQEGLTGEALTNRIMDIVSNPPQDLHMAAIDAARYMTYQNDLGKLGNSIQTMAIRNPMLRFFMPFVRTPGNLFNYAVERSPFALMTRSFYSAIQEGGAERDLALARLAIGSMTMAMIGGLTFAGYITGGGPSDKNLKEALKRTGWQPYSVKIGDSYYSYNRVDPLGMIIGLSADLAEVTKNIEDEQDQSKVEKAAIGGIFALAKNIFSKTYLKGIADLVEAIHDPDRRGEKFVANLAGGFIPAIVAQTERIYDPILQETDGILARIKSRIPGWSETLPPKRDLWGNPIVPKGALGPDWISPIAYSEKMGGKIDEEIARNKIRVGMPQKHILGVELTPEEYDRYVQLAGNEMKDSEGRGLKDILEEIVKSEDYQRQSEGPEGGRSVLIHNYVNRYRAIAQRKLMEENPALLARVTEAQQKKLAARKPIF